LEENLTSEKRHLGQYRSPIRGFHLLQWWSIWGPWIVSLPPSFASCHLGEPLEPSAVPWLDFSELKEISTALQVERKKSSVPWFTVGKETFTQE